MEQKGIDGLKAGGRIYFIGIGGISMSGLAVMSKGYGFVVGGSDMNPSERTEELASKGIKIYNTQIADNLIEFKPDYIVKTAAVLPGNPEVAYAVENGIRIFDRSEYLGLITESYSRVINISGTHGKTTTTSMTSLMLIESLKDPTVHLGAELAEFGGTIRMGGNRDVLVSEACEFKRSFLQFRSTTAAITNIDHDHVDCYPT
ncbi:MAG: UDP-N-acetylmuramate--L-alanine ligase, partial [Clostridiales bacterium]|nr:UDP-N-acetylmuramate--L-alanine ligase [Clostridiales bacterium]